MKGDLIIQFAIEFPSTVTPAEVKALQQLLPGPHSQVDDDEDGVEECVMRDFVPADMKNEGDGERSGQCSNL